MIKRLLHNDWFIASLFLIVYLLTNSYIFAWDDQHLEIPLLKHLIDPTLYKGDYYVDALAKNFSSYLFPVLAKFISTHQIPAVYLVLFLISRLLMFYWVYRLWQWLAGERWAAAMAVLMFFLLGRTEEFLYRTFSHQEFSYIFMFGGFYYFYRERFILAALLLGVGANFHAIYNLFPMLYMMAFLVFARQWGTAVNSAGVFLLAALPFLLWQIPRFLAHHGLPSIPISEWMPLYLISCQQNFLFWTVPLGEALQHLSFVLIRLEPYLYLLVLYLALCFLEPRLRRDNKTHAVVGVSYVLIMISFIFSYITPSRFVLDLNLLRNEQFVRFLMMGYATLYACRVTKEGRPWQALFAAIFFFMVGFGSVTFLNLKLHKYFYVPILFVILFIGLCRWPQALWLRRLLIILPMAAAFVGYTLYHVQYLRVKKYGAGIWQLHRNWVDMQNYVRQHTPKDALILTPYDTETGGFRIFSERKVLVCYRDCGVIGFDYPAVVEWNKRVKDIEGFRMMTKESFEPAVVNAILKYRVDYIVFMNYHQPSDANSVLKKLYQNEVLSLYEVQH